MRDPEGSEAFSPAQLDRVTAAADGISVRLQTGQGLVEDPLFAGRLLRTLVWTGMHVSVLSGGWRVEEGEDAEYHPPIRSDSIRDGMLYWRRPKTGRPIPMPISRQIAPWLGEFLDQPKPTSRQRYNQILERVGRKAGTHVNPLRCRHTCGVLLYHSLGVDAATVQKLIGVTPQTMMTYVVRPISEVRRELADKGW